MSNYKFKHFYFNKYILSAIKQEKYFISYDYKHKALWFRNYKVASRTIDQYLKAECLGGEYIYGSEMSYNPKSFIDFFKFAFVRHPETKLVSAWKNKVLERNYFKFEEEEHYYMQNDFEAFVDWVSTQEIAICDEHLRAQHALIDLNQIDFLGRFENFDKDFAVVAERLKISSYKPKQVHLNPSKAKKEITLSSRVKEKIREIYEMDYRIFYPD